MSFNERRKMYQRQHSDNKLNKLLQHKNITHTNSHENEFTDDSLKHPFSKKISVILKILSKKYHYLIVFIIRFISILSIKRKSDSTNFFFMKINRYLKYHLSPSQLMNLAKYPREK